MLGVARGLASRLRLKRPRCLLPARLACVARGLASRLRLKRLRSRCNLRVEQRRQGIGFSPEIETQVLLCLAAPRRRRQGIGFSPEIETHSPRGIHGAGLVVARGLASRLRLKLRSENQSPCRVHSRQGIGFSPEIETLVAGLAPGARVASPGDWLLA